MELIYDYLTVDRVHESVCGLRCQVTGNFYHISRARSERAAAHDSESE